MKQTTAVLEMMRANPQGITALDALKELGVARLAARINDLRDMGHWIETRMVEVPTRGGKARVAKHRITGSGGDL